MRLLLVALLLVALIAASNCSAMSRSSAARPLAMAPPGVRVIVVNRDGVIAPGGTSPVTALCPSTHAAISWGFQAITFPLSGPINASFLGVRPIVRTSGVVAGWIAMFRNPNAVPTSVRVQATCAQGVGGVTLRGGAQRVVETARGEPRELILTLHTKTGTAPARRVTSEGIDCPAGHAPLTGGVEPTGGLVLAALLIGVEDDDFDVAIRLLGLDDDKEAYRMFALCMRGRNLDVGLTGRATGKPGQDQLVVERGAVKVLIAGAEPRGFSISCPKGVSLGIGFQPAAEDFSPGSVPPPLSWVHRPREGKPNLFEARQRQTILGRTPNASSFPVGLFSLCLEAAKFSMLRNGGVTLGF